MTNIPDDNVTKDNAPKDNLPKDNVISPDDQSAKRNEDLNRIKHPDGDSSSQTENDSPEIIRRGNRGQ